MTGGGAFTLDASALLALLHDEPGAEVVRQVVVGASVSSLNWSEVVQKALDQRIDTGRLRAYTERLDIAVFPFDEADAEAAARLWLRSGAQSLSLADRACLALARRLGAVAVTADHAWSNADTGVEVRLIR
ncbi:MAG: PIN domain-containing protein [Dehalococcoidia bacterium]|nr:PIN domain-containing protein [Dehalococcoidia bacterium]